jgi:hypothetical protein
MMKPAGHAIANDPIGLGRAMQEAREGSNPLLSKEANAARFSFYAGALVRQRYRDALERLKFLGHDVEWIEQNAVVRSTFVVKGDHDALEAVRAAIRPMLERAKAGRAAR